MLKLQNTMTREKETFTPRDDRIVRMFTCGPSIYRRPHVGNYRTFTWEDALQRYLEYKGYDVRRVINLTDVEDKAIEEAEQHALKVGELTRSVSERFEEESRLLRIKLPEKIPRASTSIEQSVYLIRRLLDSGHAYSHNGDIFFDPLKFGGFGRLYRLDMSRWPKQRRRFKKDTYPGQRWNLGDFILWHAYKGGDGVYWDTEIGKGRPSWNIQDPAMISENLGYELDIFCGGIDNLVRHHDYNIAVMESVSGKELSRYWLHGEHVLSQGRKMSKSLNNEVFPEDLLTEGFSWQHIRYYLLSRHYRKKLNLTMESFRSRCQRLDTLRSQVGDILNGQSGTKTAGDEKAKELTAGITSRFQECMDNDLDTRAGIDSVEEAVSELHRLRTAGKIGKAEAARIGEALRKVDSVLQVIFK